MIVSVLIIPFSAEAGFGISPPYVKPHKPVFPGARYEQGIFLLRSTADEPLMAEITVYAPEIEDWITIDKGTEFEMPKGELRVPMTVRVDVPETAEIGHYTGNINIKVVPKVTRGGGGVAIALGARVDIDLDVTNEQMFDFRIRKVDIPDFESLEKPWSWWPFSWFYHRIKLAVRIENTGNVPVAPSKVRLDVYDAREQDLFESFEDKSLDEVPAFETGAIDATFPTKLGPGQYWGRYRIYRDNDVIQKDKILFTITEPGELGGRELGIWPYVMLGSMIFAVLLFILYMIKKRVWRYPWRLLGILVWPLRFALLKLRIIRKKLKAHFWRWLHKKSAQYQAMERQSAELDEGPEPAVKDRPAPKRPTPSRPAPSPRKKQHEPIDLKAANRPKKQGDE